MEDSMSNKNDVREIHGDEFAEGLDEQFELDGADETEPADDEHTEELEYTPSLRTRVVNGLLAILQSRMAFWLAGFVDGLIVGLIIAYIRSK